MFADNLVDDLLERRLKESLARKEDLETTTLDKTSRKVISRHAKHSPATGCTGSFLLHLFCTFVHFLFPHVSDIFCIVFRRFLHCSHIACYFLILLIFRLLLLLLFLSLLSLSTHAYMYMYMPKGTNMRQDILLKMKVSKVFQK